MDRYDFFGRKLAVGDMVAFVESGCRDLRYGKILALNEKQATIKDVNYDGPFPNKMGRGKTCREYNRIVKDVYADSNEEN